MRQQTENLRQNIQELNTKLQTEQSLCIQEQVEPAEMEETLGQQEEPKDKEEVICLKKNSHHLRCSEPWMKNITQTKKRWPAAKNLGD